VKGETEEGSLLPSVLEEIKDELPLDKGFRLIYRKPLSQIRETKMDENGPKTTFQEFRIDPKTELMYCIRGGEDRLCIPAALHQKVFELGHDSRAHPGIERTYSFLRPYVFLIGMQKMLKKDSMYIAEIFRFGQLYRCDLYDNKKMTARNH
jgi:hypothetical protein